MNYFSDYSLLGLVHNTIEVCLDLLLHVRTYVHFVESCLPAFVSNFCVYFFPFSVQKLVAEMD